MTRLRHEHEHEHEITHFYAKDKQDQNNNSSDSIRIDKITNFQSRIIFLSPTFSHKPNRKILRTAKNLNEEFFQNSHNIFIFFKISQVQDFKIKPSTILKVPQLPTSKV